MSKYSSPPSHTPLPRSFYNRPTLQVARDLIGKRLFHLQEGVPVGGIIVETEAYCGETDLGCHAKAGRTKRTLPMYGPPGHAYVYFTYGNHWLFCAVTLPEGQPEAVLVRAIIPTAGLEIIQARRGKQPRKHWTDGPGKLAQALGISGAHNTLDICAPGASPWIEEGISVPDQYVTSTPRIGLYTVPEPWKSIEWRYVVRPDALTELSE